MTPRPKSDKVKRHISIPKPLDEWVKQQAAEHNRDWSGEIVTIIQDAQRKAEKKEADKK